jgi:cell division protein FtsI (penicillin-binding protein 3)
MEPRFPRVRYAWVAIMAVLWMGAVLARLTYLQLFNYSDYLARARRQQQRIVETSPRRGSIYDRNLREMAMSISMDSCFAVPSEIADAQMVARLLAAVLQQSEEEIHTKLKASRSFVWIARKLPPETVERIQSLNLRGIYFQKESRRFYPKRELAAHVLGYVDVDEKGLGGIEYQFDARIRSKPGKLMILTDARHRWYDRNEQSPSSGGSIVLTLDEKIQYIAEKELARAVATTGARAGTIVVQDPSTGELLAMANYPHFNPNAPGDSPAENRMNRAVAALYEPGSTFKLVTLAAALEEKITRPEEWIDCQMGAIFIAGHRIRDHKPFGVLQVTDVMAKSSDVGMIKLGLRLGAPKFHDYIRAFGFGRDTGIELPGETRGLLRGVEKWTPVSVGSISMGQEIGVTSVQLVSAFSAIANGGLLYAPRIVRGMRNGDEVLPAEANLPTQVVSPETAATMRRILENVVLNGTGNLAQLEGYTAGGKTGTAQKIDPATGRYSLTHHIASFVGFAPINTPAVTVLVILDSPVGLYHGGDVAAPVFKRVTEQVLAYMDVPQDVPVDAPRGRSRERLDTARLMDVSDFSPEQAENTVASQLPVFPAEPLPDPKKDTAQTVALAEGQGVSVPRLTGLSVRSVTQECLRLGLNPVLIGTGVAMDQNPAPGQTVRRGGRITIRFARAASARSGN